MYPRILLCCLLALPAPLLAQATADDRVVGSGDAVLTGDAWVDRQLADINRYADWYPDAFVDELFRYADVPHAYAQALLQQHGWSAADLYFAAFWGKASGLGYRELVRARSQQPQDSWKALLEGLPEPAQTLQWRALRHALVASYDHWDRPIQLDALLRRQLGDREQRDQAAAVRHGSDKP